MAPPEGLWRRWRRDYRHLAGPESLHGATNYEAYKGFWSSANDRNMHEVAYALKRQFQSPGIYRHLSLVNFLDNHDVNRIASVLAEPAHLYPLHLLLLTLPGTPALYYGSETGLAATKGQDDWPLRPRLRPEGLSGIAPSLPGDIARLAALRREHPVLAQGAYRELSVGPDWLVFQRGEGQDAALVLVSLAQDARTLEVSLAGLGDSGAGLWRDVLNGGDFAAEARGLLRLELPGCWGRVLRPMG